MKVLIITPVRNEELYLPITIGCMVRQSLLPIEWIIVDDGSSDKTEKIALKSIEEYDFIKYIKMEDRGYRKPGQGVIEAFYEGYSKIENKNYDVIVKFDGDLEFPDNTIEIITETFKNNSLVGITGGVRYERRENGGPFRRVLVPNGFVGGPSKFYRRECFEDIGGLIKRAGWDGVDTINANMKGWKTGEIRTLKILHLRPTGTAKGEGRKRACEKYGDVSYFMGGYFWYFIIRVVGRSIQVKSLEVGYYMLKGYYKSWKVNEPRRSSKFRRFLKQKQIHNICYWMKLLIWHKRDEMIYTQGKDQTIL